jgi:hypothetical protein
MNLSGLIDLLKGKQGGSGGPIDQSYWVLPERFLVGGYPAAWDEPATWDESGMWDESGTRKSLRRLLLAGVTFFLDLTQEGEHGAEPYAALLADDARALGRAAEHRRMPIPDMETPSHAEMGRVLDAIDDALGAGHVVYLHCFGGVGRTGTVVGCYLVRHGMSGDEALKEIARLRRGVSRWPQRSPVTPAQRAMVRNWIVGR